MYTTLFVVCFLFKWARHAWNHGGGGVEEKKTGKSGRQNVDACASKRPLPFAVFPFLGCELLS